jgi:hypothetical protein
MRDQGVGTIVQGDKPVQVSFQVRLEDGVVGSKGSFWHAKPDIWLTKNPAILQFESGESYRIEITEVHTQPYGAGEFEVL